MVLISFGWITCITSGACMWKLVAELIIFLPEKKGFRFYYFRNHCFSKIHWVPKPLRSVLSICVFLGGWNRGAGVCSWAFWTYLNRSWVWGSLCTLICLCVHLGKCMRSSERILFSLWGFPLHHHRNKKWSFRSVVTQCFVGAWGVALELDCHVPSLRHVLLWLSVC